MFNFLKSTFSRTSDSTDAEALVEEFARQNVRLYPSDLKNFTAGVKFQNAEPQTQRTIVMAMLAWLEQHSFKSYPQDQQDQKAWADHFMLIYAVCHT